MKMTERYIQHSAHICLDTYWQFVSVATIASRTMFIYSRETTKKKTWLMPCIKYKTTLMGISTCCEYTNTMTIRAYTARATNTKLRDTEKKNSVLVPFYVKLITCCLLYSIKCKM